MILLVISWEYKNGGKTKKEDMLSWDTFILLIRTDIHVVSSKDQ